MAKGAKWVKTWINNLSALNDQFRDEDGRIDFEALGREEYAFRMALIRKDFGKSERAAEAWNDAQGRWESYIGNGKKGGRPPKKAEAQEADEGQKPQQRPPQRPGTEAYGKFGNVYISGREYSELGLLMGNQNDLNSLIDSLGASIEDGSVKSANHYATLVKWVQYRKDKAKEAKEKPHYESYTEHNKRVMERCHREIAELKEQGFFDD